MKIRVDVEVDDHFQKGNCEYCPCSLETNDGRERSFKCPFIEHAFRKDPFNYSRECPIEIAKE